QKGLAKITGLPAPTKGPGMLGMLTNPKKQGAEGAKQMFPLVGTAVSGLIMYVVRFLARHFPAVVAESTLSWAGMSLLQEMTKYLDEVLSPHLPDWDTTKGAIVSAFIKVSGQVKKFTTAVFASRVVRYGAPALTGLSMATGSVVIGLLIGTGWGILAAG